MTGSLTIATGAVIRGNDTNITMSFRNNANSERAMIYHSSTTNTLRLRSAGGTEVYINNSGLLQAQTLTSTTAVNSASVNTTSVNTTSLTVSSNNAVVSGKNIVRSVNGLNADSNGNVVVVAGVQDIRMSARAEWGNLQFVRFREGVAAYLPNGAVCVGAADYVTQEIYIEEVDALFYRYMQKQIDGVWYTVGVL